MASRVNEYLKNIVEFHSTPTMPDGSSGDGDFANGRIGLLFAAGPPLSLYEESIAFLNSNATAILFPLNSMDAIAAKMTYRNTQEAYRELETVNALVQRNEYQKAESVCWQSLKKFPTPEAYLKLSSLYMFYKNYSDVESICRRGLITTRVIKSGKEVYIDEFDVYSFIYLNLGVALQEQGKIQEAKAAFLKSAAINPSLIEEYKSYSNAANNDLGYRKSTSTSRKKKIFGMKPWQVIVLGVMVLIFVSSLLFFMSIVF